MNKLLKPFGRALRSTIDDTLVTKISDVIWYNVIHGPIDIKVWAKEFALSKGKSAEREFERFKRSLKLYGIPHRLKMVRSGSGRKTSRKCSVELLINQEQLYDMFPRLNKHVCSCKKCGGRQ